MRKPIFESEEEYSEFIKLGMPAYILDKYTSVKRDLINTAFENGFIKKSPVEEAEEIIKEFEYCKHHPEGQIVEIRSSDCVKVYEGFNLLKKQLEEKC